MLPANKLAYKKKKNTQMSEDTQKSVQYLALQQKVEERWSCVEGRWRCNGARKVWKRPPPTWLLWWRAHKPHHHRQIVSVSIYTWVYLAWHSRLVDAPGCSYSKCYLHQGRTQTSHMAGKNPTAHQLLFNPVRRWNGVILETSFQGWKKNYSVPL